MKVLIISLLALFLATAGQAQRGVNSLYREYKHAGEERIHFQVPGLLFWMASQFGENRTERRLIRSIKNVKLLVIEKGNPITPAESDKMIRKAEKSGIENLIMVRDGRTRVNIMGREKNGKIRNLLIMVNEEDEFVLISMRTRLRISDLNDLIELMQKQRKDKKPLPVKLPTPPKKVEVV